jgi:hypothetical protein
MYRLAASLGAAVLLSLAIAGRAAEPAAEKPAGYEELDKHALRAPPEAEASPAKLAKYLAEPCKTDRDKARVIFRWIADRIAYDTEAVAAGRPGALTAAGVLKGRKAACEGYANLFTELARGMDLKAVRVAGYVKGVGYTPGDHFVRPNHSWSAVEIGGSWQLLDPTWGAGYLKDGKFEKHLRDCFFLTPPEALIFTHLPAEKRWQLLDTPLPLKEFERQPFVDPSLFELGVGAKELRGAMAAKGFREFVRPAEHGNTRITAVGVPLSKHLRAGTEYTFELKSEDFGAFVLSNGGNKPVFLEKADGVFRGKITPQKGQLLVAAGQPGAQRFEGFLEYVVEE